ncbi:MAG: glutamate-5-semialdehyde dehydrogenase [Rhodospirillaceae bacterium]|nr:glutamate-5-semialdehyde dehydrogenase [Rhodospirillaceae bacterium]|tara:strand:- start:970 stop:2253 length:1284 start_codon:yes stop_codon:yes gene_type:complete
MANDKAREAVHVVDLMDRMGADARSASAELATASTVAKNHALHSAATAIRSNAEAILSANNVDLDDVKSGNADPAFVDRLELTADRISSMADGLDEVAELADPVGEVMDSWVRPNGLRISRVRVPLGVIGIIYESRPNVTADAGALCIKSGNAAILRGGSESFNSSQAIAACLSEGLQAADLRADCVQLVPTRSREAVGQMLGMTEYIDVIVPRGGRSLTERVSQESKVAVLKHLDGICHIYLDAAADPIKAEMITVNAKMRRTGICGAAETILVHKDAVQTALPGVVKGLLESGCEVRGDALTQLLDDRVLAATVEDWDTEYLAPIISIKVVGGLQDAIQHIGKHGSHHTDSIITEDPGSAEEFMNRVDSGIVLHNASTQFADGGEFGMGAEIGISTGKLHARGPVGVEQLTSYKYLVHGEGQVRP